MWLVLRPEHKIDSSQHAFEQAGIPSIGLALQTILPRDDIAEQVHLVNFHHVDNVIFTSKMAAQFALPFMPDLSSHTYVYAVGKSTFQTLAQWTHQYPFWCNNHQLMMPLAHQQTSEGILSLPSLSDVTEQRIVIVKGLGGRETLRDTLSERGAVVSECTVYERITLNNPVSTQAWQVTDITGITATSNEQLQLVFDIYPHSWLTELKWVVVSPRIAQHALKLGIPNQQISISQSADDAALIAHINQLME